MFNKNNKKSLTMMPKSNNFHPKFTPNRPKWCLGTLPKWSWKQVCSWLRKKTLNLPGHFSFLAPLGRFWGSFGAQLGAKEVPKINIFGTKLRQNLKKCHLEWSIRKNMNCWLNFCQKKWDFEGAEPSQMFYI